MPNAIDVARHIVRFAATADGGGPQAVCPLRLQRLLYYVQGWHLAAFGRPLFPERLEAWKTGPVVREVWAFFKPHGKGPIDPDQVGEPTSLRPRDLAFVEGVWEEHKQYSAIELVRKVHGEAPWREVWAKRDQSNGYDGEIPHHLLQAFFAPKVRARMVPGVDLDRLFEETGRPSSRLWLIDRALWNNASAEIAAGQGKSTGEALRGMGSHHPADDPFRNPAVGTPD